jgi:hypothetical protein
MNVSREDQPALRFPWERAVKDLWAAPSSTVSRA